MISNRRNMSLLFATLVIVMMGFGLVIPILPFYVTEMGASGRDLGLIMAVFALMQLIFAPIWGQLSDRIGRKPVLIIGVMGNALSMLLLGLSTELWMVFASRALAGVLSSATLPTAMAYIGDSTTYEDRSAGMGVIGAAMGLGMVLGPGLGGWLAARSLSLPFFVAAGLSVVVALLIVVVLPESLPPERRAAREGPMRALSPGQLRDALLGPMGYLMFLAFLLSFGLTNFEAVFGLYALQRYGYGTAQVGTILTAIGLTSVVVQGGLTGPLTRRWGEVRVILGALLLSAIGFVVMLLPETFVGVLLATCVFMVGNAMLRPTVSSMISQRAGEAQGAAMGLNNSFMSLGRIAGPIWAGLALDRNLALPYLSGAVVMASGFVSTWIWSRRQTGVPQEEVVAAGGVPLPGGD
jgi:DHA1 family multidrug resistance protein-like MFS transporter